MQRFESRPLPAQHRGFVSELVEANQSKPFTFKDPRATAERIGPIALRHGLEHKRIRGNMGLPGCELDHVWLTVCSSALGGEPVVIDLAIPAQDPEFLEALRGYVAGDVEPNTIETLVARTPIEARVLGEFDEPLAYLGRAVYMDR